MKHLHTALAKCLENCNRATIYCVLFNLLRKYKDQKVQIKLPDLILNCLYRLNQIYEKDRSAIDAVVVLSAIHAYLLSINADLTQNDGTGISIATNFTQLLLR